MKRTFRVGLGAAFCVLALLCLGGTGVQADVKPGAGPIPQVTDNNTHFDANSIDMWVTNHGSFAWDIPSGGSGLIYPKGTQKTAVFAAGLWMGAVVNGEIRVAVAEYSQEYAPGKILTPTTYTNEDDPNVAPKYQMYKIDRGDNAENNSDYANWPVDDGAPVDSAGNPLLLGDQTLWSVYHDLDPDSHNNDAGNTDPLGIEIQQTTFGFNRPGPLGNVAFLKFKILNKGPNTLDSTFISLWSDPDLGGAGDDLVGCDVDLSLGYCYNATNRDNLYASTPPAVGFDFFQGPIVPSEGDTAYVSGVAVPNYRNLPMTSFNKYINGTDPDSPPATYNYMNGLNRDGSVYLDCATNQPSTYFVSGDPVTGEGCIDTNPSDRRLMLSSGPFTMAPGDSQEVVAALIVGQGRDRLTSITALRFNDFFAQAAFDAGFDLPNAPPAPVVESAELDEAVTLSWGRVSELEYDEPGYAFEGYNVYQGESVAGPWKLLATFDVNNSAGIIFDEQFDAESGVVINRPAQFGSDSGVDYTITITEDAIKGGPLRNAKPYFFAVTSYSYNPGAGAGLKTLENAIEALELVPQSPVAGSRLEEGPIGTIVSVQRAGGISDGSVVPVVVDPASVTGDLYEITFANAIVVENGDSVEVPVWNLRNVTDNVDVLTNQRNQSGDEAYLVRDGIQWKVLGPPAGFKTNDRPNPMIDEVRSGGGEKVTPDTHGGPGNDVFHSFNSTGEYLLGAGGGDGGVGRLTRDGADGVNLMGKDILMKWDYSPDNIGWWAFDSGEIGQVPYGLYQVDPVSQAETRVLALLFGGGGTAAVYDFDPAVIDPFTGFVATDWTYAYTFTGSYDDFLADARDNGAIDNDTSQLELFARLIVADGDEVPAFPDSGTVIRFVTTKPNTSEDRFVIDTRGISFSEATLKADLSQIRVVPNPYRAHSIYELNQFDRRVKFTRLPTECTIRIFTLAGDLVRTLVKEPSTSSILEWDLLTDRQLPVASGIYIYHVEATSGGSVIGTTNGKMAIFVEKERLNTF